MMESYNQHGTIRHHFPYYEIEFEVPLQNKEPMRPPMPFVTYDTVVLECNVSAQKVEAQEDKKRRIETIKVVQGHRHYFKQLKLASHFTLLLYC